DAPHAATGPHPPADLTEIVRLYGLRPWIEQSYKQIKDELGWADFQVRSDRAIRRHQTLANCAFSFCWDQWFAPPQPLDATAPDPCPDEGSERGTRPVPPAPTALLAQGLTSHPFKAKRSGGLAGGIVTRKAIHRLRRERLRCCKSDCSGLRQLF
ncbi:hypothetical protein PV367_43370, partial [Streptomyces europaeiscabiei]|nr:hypothetical protein [Streptomyces europaeiscabiei]